MPTPSDPIPLTLDTLGAGSAIPIVALHHPNDVVWGTIVNFDFWGYGFQPLDGSDRQSWMRAEFVAAVKRGLRLLVKQAHERAFPPPHEPGIHWIDSDGFNPQGVCDGTEDESRICGVTAKGLAR